MADFENNTPHELGWDEEISYDGGQFVLLEEGDYNFIVTGFERGRFPGGKEEGKIPPCNKATLTLHVETVEGEASVKYDLLLWSTLEWKISAFFRAIGQKKHGEAFRPNWNQVVGAQGRARFKPRTYTGRDGEPRQTNDIEKFYDYDPAFFTPANNTPANGWTPGAF